jgi:nitric oxide reductase large subunit
MPNSRVARSNVSRVKKEKKPTAIQIGNANEARTAAYYENLGYQVETTKRGKYASNDFFGLFDHFVIGANDARLVQTKTNTLPSPAYREKIKAFVVPPGMIKEIVVWKDDNPNPLIYRY